MEILSKQAIISVIRRRDANIIYDPTSVAYVYYLLTPFATTMSGLKTYRSVKHFTLNNLGKEIGENALALAEHENEGAEEYFEDIDADKNHKYTDIEIGYLKSVKESIITYLLNDFIKIINEGAQVIDNTILPWDINRVISSDYLYSQIINLGTDINNIDVSVTVAGSVFHHRLSLELTTGLSLFGLITKTNYNIRIYGENLSVGYFIGNNRFRIRPTNPIYSVDINGAIFFFSTPDFMQGFITGAMWNNVNHRNYWKSLTGYINGLETRITF